MEGSIVQRLFFFYFIPYRQFQCKLMPTVSPDAVIGVRMPVLRRMAKQLRGTREGEAFLSQLPHTYYEENNLHGLLLCDMADYRGTVAALDRFLPFVDNWATCDLLSPKSFRSHPAQLPSQVWEWLHSTHTYTVRFGLGVLLRFYLEDYFDPKYLQWATGITQDEYYVQMMVAWYFAEALVKQSQAAIPYLTEHRLSRWTHNKTIQKAVESYRISPEQKIFLRSLRRP